MIRYGLIATCFVCLLIGGVGRAHGLDPSRHITQYAHTAWRVQDGIFGGTPNAITQTPDGYLWIGTLDGLVRFDGVRFVSWTAPEGMGLPSSEIFSLLTARDGSLWIGTGRGLARWRDGILVNYTDPPGRVNGILEDREGTIWMVRTRIVDQSGPLCRVTGEMLHCYGVGDGLACSYGAALAVDGEGSLWVGSSEAVCRWKPGSSSTYLQQELKPTEGLSGVGALIAKGSLVWAGITRAGKGLGLQKFVNGSWITDTVPGMDRATLAVNSMLLDRNDSFWIGTVNQGIYRVSGGKADHFRSADGLSSDVVADIYEDHEGNVWVATSKGIDRFRDLRVTTFSTKEGLTTDGVASVLAARDGTVWIGNEGGLNVLRKNVLSRITSREGLPGEDITSLFEDHASRLWVGVDGKLAVYERGRFRLVPRPDGSGVGVIVAMAEDTDHNIWVSVVGRGEGLLRVQDFRVTKEISSPPPEELANALAADPKGGIWMGLLRNGLGRYRNGQFVAVPSGDSGSVRNLSVDPDGSIWAATSKKGLMRWKDGELKTLTSKNGLPCDDIFALVRDNTHALWLYSKCGLVAIAESELQRWWGHPESNVKVRMFDVLDGAQPELAPFCPAASRSPDGRLWFANEKVLQMVDPSRLIANAMTPPVHVEAIIADRKSYSPREGVRLPALTQNLEIDYTALSLVIPEKVRFRYRLEGHDATWQDPGTRRQAFYSDLRPGTYKFHVIASNNDGIWNEAGASLDFSILSAYYQTNWFRAMCGAAFLVSLWAIYQFRVRQLRRQFAIGLEARVNERTRIARELHDTLLQSFNALLLRFQTAADLLSTRPDEARRTLDSTIDQTAQALIEGRDAVQQLRPTGLATSDLVCAIVSLGQALADGLNGDAPAFHVEVEGTPRDLLPITRDEVYRIAGEALRNAFRHARACRIEVDIRYDRRQLRLQIRDNGQGIDPQLLRTDGLSGHYGLRGMRERAQSLGGELTIWSQVNAGTEIDLTVPSSGAYAKLGLSGFRILARRRKTKS
jgi:signal transduction histidine kinase/ligand-binding sensor domain-containing protein